MSSACPLYFTFLPASNNGISLNLSKFSSFGENLPMFQRYTTRWFTPRYSAKFLWLKLYSSLYLASKPCTSKHLSSFLTISLSSLSSTVSLLIYYHINEVIVKRFSPHFPKITKEKDSTTIGTANLITLSWEKFWDCNYTFSTIPAFIISYNFNKDSSITYSWQTSKSTTPSP